MLSIYRGKKGRAGHKNKYAKFPHQNLCNQYLVSIWQEEIEQHRPFKEKQDIELQGPGTIA